ITTGPIDFAVPGGLDLTATATSHTQQAVAGQATVQLAVAPFVGLTSSFDPGAKVIPVPGTADFLLLVNNTGNTDDAYSATILTTSGPIRASRAGLDGQPTHTIPLFRLPGLATGAILLHTDLASAGEGDVTVRVTSLSDPSRIATATATVRTATVTTT